MKSDGLILVCKHINCSIRERLSIPLKNWDKLYLYKKNKSIRSPGGQDNSLSVKTRDGFDLDISYSNQVWQCDHTRADILLVDRHGELVARPWLTTVIDSYSRCIVGINLGFDAPSSNNEIRAYSSLWGLLW